MSTSFFACSPAVFLIKASTYKIFSQEYELYTTVWLQVHYHVDAKDWYSSKTLLVKELYLLCLLKLLFPLE